MSILKKVAFNRVNQTDSFFDTLRTDYSGFDNWFQKKAQSEEQAYIFQAEHGGIEGFLYLKQENGVVDDVTPSLPVENRLKIGTFKVNPHGTRLGERLIKKAFDHALDLGVDEIYLTVFPKHTALIELLSKYGFKKVARKPCDQNECEDVMLRSLSAAQGDVVFDYPRFRPAGGSKYILSIYPTWHTRLLPDSKLNNEPPDIVEDVSHTNSIHKVYLTGMQGTESLKRGDILAIYRTSDGQGPAHYRSVITSIGVVEEVRDISTFGSLGDLIAFCAPYSVFTDDELREFWHRRKYRTFIRFTYNAALKKRLTRGDLIDRNVIDPKAYAGFMPLNDQQLNTILELGGVDESLIIN